MSIVQTFDDLVEPPRADGVPYTQIEIAEALDVDGVPGAWVTLEVQALVPVTVDPEHPLPREITTTLATTEDAWYRFRYLDAATGVSRWTEPLFTGLRADEQIRPSMSDVAALVRARTKVVGGSEAGTFTAGTRPTADEVEALIDEAADEVLGKVAVPEPGTPYARRVTGAIRLYTAMLIELSYYPEQIGTARSPYSAYEALYERRVKALIAEGETGSPQGEGGEGDSPGDASWWFPDDAGGLVGWGSQW